MLARPPGPTRSSPSTRAPNPTPGPAAGGRHRGDRRRPSSSRADLGAAVHARPTTSGPRGSARSAEFTAATGRLVHGQRGRRRARARRRTIDQAVAQGHRRAVELGGHGRGRGARARWLTPGRRDPDRRHPGAPQPVAAGQPAARRRAGGPGGPGPTARLLRSGSVRSGPVRSGPYGQGPTVRAARSGSVRSGAVRSGSVRSGPTARAVRQLRTATAPPGPATARRRAGRRPAGAAVAAARPTAPGRPRRHRRRRRSRRGSAGRGGPGSARATPVGPARTPADGRSAVRTGGGPRRRHRPPAARRRRPPGASPPPGPAAAAAPAGLAPPPPDGRTATVPPRALTRRRSDRPRRSPPWDAPDEPSGGDRRPVTLGPLVPAPTAAAGRPWRSPERSPRPAAGCWSPPASSPSPSAILVAVVLGHLLVALRVQPLPAGRPYRTFTTHQAGTYVVYLEVPGESQPACPRRSTSRPPRCRASRSRCTQVGPARRGRRPRRLPRAAATRAGPWPW